MVYSLRILRYDRSWYRCNTRNNLEEQMNEALRDIFAEMVKAAADGICPFCGKKVNTEDFKDELSRQEFRISGLCQKCQDETFVEPTI